MNTTEIKTTIRKFGFELRAGDSIWLCGEWHGVKSILAGGHYGSKSVTVEFSGDRGNDAFSAGHCFRVKRGEFA